MVNVTKYREAVRRHYHTMTARRLGLPEDNLWYYPEVYYWERDENGLYVIPAIVAFNVNPTLYWDADRRTDLHFLLLQNTGTRWDVSYDYLSHGVIIATRLSHSVVVKLDDSNTYRHIEYASHDIEVTTHRIPLLRQIYRGLVHDDWRRRIPLEMEE